MTRNDVLTALKRNLRARSQTRWSVTGGRGTSYGWIRIRKAGTTWMEPDECSELAGLLGKESVHPQGESIPAGNDYYREYIERTAGRTPTTLGKPYWD